MGILPLLVVFLVVGFVIGWVFNPLGRRKHRGGKKTDDR